MARKVDDLLLPRVDSTGPLSQITITPTLDTLIYASGDSLATAIQQFPNVTQIAGGACKIRKMVVVDQSAQTAGLELWLFDSAVTPAAANAAHSISDADALHLVGVLKVATADYVASALNTVAVITPSPAMEIVLPTTTLYGLLVTRGTPTYAANSLQIALTVEADN